MPPIALFLITFDLIGLGAGAAIMISSKLTFGTWIP